MLNNVEVTRVKWVTGGGRSEGKPDTDAQQRRNGAKLGPNEGEHKIVLVVGPFPSEDEDDDEDDDE